MQFLAPQQVKSAQVGHFVFMILIGGLCSFAGRIMMKTTQYCVNVEVAQLVRAGVS